MNEKIKILSWNINGIRSQKGDFKQFLDDLNAHIICFQETKITRDQLEEPLALVDGYVSFFSFSRKRSGYSGVATYCKKEATPSFAQEGLSGTLNVGCLNKEGGMRECLSEKWDAKDLKDLDAEGRCIITQHPFTDENGERKLLSVLNVYCPRVDPEKPERLQFKLAFYELLKERAACLRSSGSFVVILGDLNTSHKRIDHCDPCDEEENFEERIDRIFLDNLFLNISSKISFNNEQKINSNVEKIDNENSSTDHVNKNDEELEVNCDNFKAVDTFRYFHPDEEESFTCWNTRVNARSTNYGTRLDYILCDEQFIHYVKDSLIHPDIQGSDHCPVSVELSKVRFFPAVSIPKISTKFYPEFHGSQQKLSSYFKASSHADELKPVLVEELKPKIVPRSKRKLNDSSTNSLNKKNNAPKQLTLSSFFKNSEDSLTPPESASSSSRDSDPCVPPSPVHHSGSYEDSLDNEAQVTFSDEGVKKSSVKSVTKASGWGFLMRTPAPPPLCSGHKEPSVLRTVKKKGPTFNKQFYSCARGVGKEGDPNSTCNFFKWFNHGR